MSSTRWKAICIVFLLYLMGMYDFSYAELDATPFGIDRVDDGIIGEGSIDIGDVVLNIAAYLLGFVALISVAWSIKGGFQILTASSDEEKVKKGKQTILYVLLGLFTIWLAYVIVNWGTDGIGGI